MSESATALGFNVTCPRCGQRLRFAMEAGVARVRVKCAACAAEFGVRSPGAGPGAGARGGGPATPVPLATGVPVAPDATPAASWSAGTQAGTGSPGPATFSRADGAAGGALTFQPGQLVAARYRMVRFIAQGGMGEVYEAFDEELGESIALKTVRPEVARGGAALERFRREIQLARRVTHPNVCRVFDVSRHVPEGAEPVIFLTMELLVGETLAERLRSGPMAREDALPIARQTALGLEAAHQVGIVHRDLKPGNIVLVAGKGGTRAVVTDFGLARLASAGDVGGLTHTLAEGVIGTPAYLAPEQVEGGRITPAVDIYAFGIVLYEMMTGTVPFRSDSLLATAVKRLQEAPESPRVHAPGLDPRWEAVILRCLEREPSARFHSPLEVIAALSPATSPGQENVPVEVRGDGSGDPAPPLPATAVLAPLPRPRARSEEAAPALPSPEPSGPSAFSTPSTPAKRGGAAAVRESARGPGRTVPSLQRVLRPALIVLILVSFAVAAWRFRSWRASHGESGSISPEGVTPRRSVAVLGFKDLSGNAGTRWLSPALAEMLSSELGAGGGLRVVAGENVARARVELKLEETESLARDTLARVGNLLGADAVVLGSYVDLAGPRGRQIRLDLRLQDTAGGETLATLTESGSEAELFGLVTRLGGRLRHELKAEGNAAGAQLPGSPEAARLYAEGVQRLRLFDLAGARDLLTRAVAAEPGNARAHAALASAWSSLGYDAKAREEARAAFELSAGLPQEERLLIEGRYREARQEWGHAIAIYTRVWALFPDDLDHGLRLAAAQTSGGRARDALATAAALRRLPGAARRDPRIDLAEATAAGASSDFKRQQEAAARAVERGREEGASLLVAQARLLECGALRNLGLAERALASCAEGERLAAAAGDRAGVAAALTQAANVQFDRGELAASRQLYEQALATYREIGNRGAEAGELNNLAVVLKSQGELERARQLYEQVLSISRETGSRSGEAYALNNLAGVLSRRGALEAAGQLLSQALAIRRELADKSGEASALDNLGVTLRRRGDLALARARHEEALAIRRGIGQRLGEAAALNNLGSVAFDEGDLAAARREWERALEIGRELGGNSSRAQSLFGLGQVAAQEGRIDEARQRHEEALSLRTSLGERGTAAESRLALATLLADNGDTARSDVLALGAAAELAREGETASQALALSLSALAAAARGDAAGARGAMDRAVALVGQSQDLRARATVRLRSARLAGAAEPAAAAAALATVRDEAAAAHLVQVQLEAQLALAQIEIEIELAHPKQPGSPSARGHLESARGQLERIAAAARASGFSALADRCARLANPDRPPAAIR